MDTMVSLKGSYVVTPAEETPIGIMSLSDFDLMVPSTHAPTIYFYKNPCEFALAVDILKDSLSKALVIFYPLAGRLRSIGGGRHELECNSLGAQFLVAESQAIIDDFGDFSPTPQIRALSPPVDYSTPMHELPLLLVQITKLRCGGISLGLLISHIMVDGPSAMHFIDVWAKIARGEQSSIDLPFLDRTLLRTTEEPSTPASFNHEEYSPSPLLMGRSDSLEERKKESTVAMLRLSKEKIDKLKAKANESRPSDYKSPPYTRYEVVAGHMWRCACKARENMSEQPTKLYITVDARNRVHPSLPPRYFGNAITRAAPESTSGELISKALSYASSKIREAVKKATDEYVRSSLRFLSSQEDVSKYRISHSLGCTQGNFQGNPNMAITSWTGLSLYGVDFGWGKEIHMGPGAIGFDGMSFILPGRDDDGSFMIALRLQVAHMEAFKKYFYEEI